MGKAPTGRGADGRRVVARAAEAVFLNQRRASLAELAVALAAVLVTAGGFLLVWGLFGGSDTALRFPPPAAQEIPRDVGTAAPAPVVMVTAPPMAASVPVRIEIAKLGVDAPVMRLGLNEDGTVQVPPLPNHDLAGWYTGSVTPGQEGSSVILGHVDSYDGVSVFFAIKNLKPGDQVSVVRADGSTAVFAVDDVQKVAKVAFPSSTVYGNSGYPSLRLVTCGGPFNAATGEYQDNIVVYAHLAAPS
jgi:sortase (surface protein transpeptidase)